VVACRRVVAERMLAKPRRRAYAGAAHLKCSAAGADSTLSGRRDFSPVSGQGGLSRLGDVC